MGKVLIVNNQTYYAEKGEEKNRPIDIVKEDEKVEELIKTLNDLGFTVLGNKEKKDKTKEEFIELLKNVAAKSDLKDDYCFICIVLSYGQDGVITCYDATQSPKNPTAGMQLPVSELQECLKGDKCRDLLLKPKIFMLQLERASGDYIESPATGTQAHKPVKIPREADFLTYTCERERGFNTHPKIESLRDFALHQPLISPDDNVEKLRKESRVLPNGEKIYDSQKCMGKVLIVNNQTYSAKKKVYDAKKGVDKVDDAQKGIDKEDDAEKDVDCRPINKDEEDKKVKELIKTLKGLGFTVLGDEEQKNKTKEEFIDLLKNVAAREDLKDDYCFICIVLSYGQDGVITCYDETHSPKDPTADMQLPVSELQGCLKGDKCKKLLLKPKIFMLQLEKVECGSKEGGQPGRQGRQAPSVKIPREADFLIYTSERDQAITTWNEGLKKYVLEPEQPLEIQTLLTRMNGLYWEYYMNEEQMRMDTPCVTSLLTREAYLKK
ncbi:uncharacterized protein [Magallana gigas]